MPRPKNDIPTKPFASRLPVVVADWLTDLGADTSAAEVARDILCREFVKKTKTTVKDASDAWKAANAKKLKKAERASAAPAVKKQSKQETATTAKPAFTKGARVIVRDHVKSGYNNHKGTLVKPKPENDECWAVKFDADGRTVYIHTHFLRLLAKK